MINRAQAWFAAFVIIVFAAGLAGGVVLDRAISPRPGFRGGNRGPGGFDGRGGAPGDRQPRGPGGPGGPAGRGGDGPPTQMFVKDLDSALDLSADQEKQLAAIIEASRPKMRELQEQVSKQFTDRQQALHDEILKILTPEQAKKFDQLEKDRRGGPFGFRGRR